ncbi:MAG: hypothetical protein E6I87_11875 [Chloroflexi bacterium]|nr:MAG: hypothetical protein E6I87_11875 [Chloroflexota bacterium]
MRRRIIVGALLVAGAAAVVAGMVVIADYLSDPPSASCAVPPTTFGTTAPFFDHQEVAVHYNCEGASQAGTLYLPSGPGPYAAVVWIHGAGREARLGFGGIVKDLVESGVAVFSYDKRGVGESEGSCCPGDNGHFNLLSADVVGAVSALFSRSDVRKDEIGLVGASQAGWIAPKAAVASSHVAFVALASATPVSERQTNLYERLARGDEGQLTKQEISRRLAAAGPSGFDPVPYLKQMKVPSLWLFGTEDDRIPVEESLRILDQLRSEKTDVSTYTFAGAGHGLLDTPPSDPRAPAILLDWIAKRVHLAR